MTNNVDKMTNSEAIIIIGNLPVPTDDECYTIAEYQAAKGKAIKALDEVIKIREKYEYLAERVISGRNFEKHKDDYVSS